MGIGSNLDDPHRQLDAALAALSRLPRSSLIRRSARYRNPAVGPGRQPDYINAVAELRTALAPLALLARLQGIEQQQGRVRAERWGARTLDLDLLLYGDTRLSLPELQIPHPRMLERAFVLYPLFELAPDLILPDGTSLRRRLDSCSPAALTRLDC